MDRKIKYMVYQQDNSLLGKFRGIVDAASTTEAKRQCVTKFGGKHSDYMIFPESSIEETWV